MIASQPLSQPRGSPLLCAARATRRGSSTRFSLVPTEQPNQYRLLIVSAADRGYFPLLRDMVRSVRAQRPDTAIGILDLGLDPEHRNWLSTRVTHLVRPDWDVDFPDRARTPDTLKAHGARPFLQRHFPGYARDLRIDA